MSVCDYVRSLTATVTWTLTDPANTNFPFTGGLHHYVIATTIFIHIDNVLCRGNITLGDRIFIDPKSIHSLQANRCDYPSWYSSRISHFLYSIMLVLKHTEYSYVRTRKK